VERAQSSIFVGVDRHDIRQPREFEHFTNAAIQIAQHEAAAWILHYAGINPDEEAHAGGVDVIDLAEIGQNFRSSGVLDLFSPSAQVGGISARDEPAVEPEHAQITTGLYFDEHSTVMLLQLRVH